VSIAKKVSLVFRAKAEKALDRLEDPRESLDYSYRQQVDLLTKVRRDVASTSASRARIDAHMKALRRAQANLDDQTGLASGADTEPGHRQALRRRDELQEELSRLAAEYNSALTEEERLMAIRDRLQMKVKTFRARKDATEAVYAAAEAQKEQSRLRSDLAAEADSAGRDGVPYPRQCELLAQLRSSIEEITDFSESLDREIGALGEWHAELQEPSGGTLGEEEENLALEQQVMFSLISRLISRLSAQRDSFRSDEEKLEKAYEWLAARVSGQQ
jgi:phage shock protein A